MEITVPVTSLPVDERLHRSFLDLNDVRRKHHEYIQTKYKISGLEMEIIQWVALNGKKKMKDISSHFHLKLSTLTNIVDKIEKQKLVLRRNSLEDRRVIYLEITPKGKKLYDEYGNYIAVITQLMMKELESEHIQALLNGVEKLEELVNYS